MSFPYFQNLSIKVTPNFEKYGKCLGIFANTTSKCTCIREILPYVRGMKVVLGPCIHLKLYISSRGTPYLEMKKNPVEVLYLVFISAYSTRIWYNIVLVCTEYWTQLSCTASCTACLGGRTASSPPRCAPSPSWPGGWLLALYTPPDQWSRYTAGKNKISDIQR